jgi:hypothetical protein
MSGQSTSTLSALLRPNVQSEVLDLQFRKTDFFDALRAAGRISDLAGPSPHQWNVVTAVNASIEVFTEGEAPPAAGKQTFAQASLSAFYVRGVAGETGHVRDNRKKGGYYADPFNTEKMLAQADVFYKVESELMGSTADRGIAACIDATGTYASLSQSTYASWASEENGSVGVLSIDAMQGLFEELTTGSVSSVPRGAMPTHVLMPTNQITNYLNTVGPGASSGALWRTNAGQTFDVGLQKSSPTFNGMTIVPCRLMTTTEVYMVDLTDIELLIHRDLQVDPILGNPELESYQISAAFLFKIGHRNHHGKMTGVTA